MVVASLVLLVMSAPIVSEVDMGAVEVFLMGKTGACPLVGGTYSYPSGRWGFLCM